MSGKAENVSKDELFCYTYEKNEMHEDDRRDLRRVVGRAWLVDSDAMEYVDRREIAETSSGLIIEANGEIDGNGRKVVISWPEAECVRRGVLPAHMYKITGIKSLNDSSWRSDEFGDFFYEIRDKPKSRTLMARFRVSPYEVDNRIEKAIVGDLICRIERLRMTVVRLLAPLVKVAVAVSDFMNSGVKGLKRGTHGTT
jgi:hypothetical protein